MNKINLVLQNNSIQVGDKCEASEPNLLNDTIFMLNGEVIGFYIKQAPKKISALIGIANAELNSNRVPKSDMSRGAASKKCDATRTKQWTSVRDPVKPVPQHSTILGSVAPKPHMRKPYPSISSVHSVKTAQALIRAMLLLASESEKLIKEVSSDLWLRQAEEMAQVPKAWRFGNLWTSAICNGNISAPFHRDTANMPNCCNVVLISRSESTGGNLVVPEFGLTIDSCDSSFLVFQAWRSIHGVTPIEILAEGGYRNSFILYPLKAFKMLED